ncbi:hypothetical protein LVN52_004416, partial [Salmonella enterica]|nr:hypothetical protein [Salmonella enterica]
MKKYIRLFLALIGMAITSFNAPAAEYTYQAPKGRWTAAPVSAVALDGGGFNGILMYINKELTFNINIGSGRSAILKSGFPSKLGLLWNDTNSALIVCDVAADGTVSPGACKSDITNFGYAPRTWDRYIMANTPYPAGLNIGGTFKVTFFYEWPSSNTLMTIVTDDNIGTSSVPVSMEMTGTNTQINTPCPSSCQSNVQIFGSREGGVIKLPPLSPVAQSLSITAPTSLSCTATLPSACEVSGDITLKTAVPATFTVQNNTANCDNNQVSVQAQSGGGNIDILTKSYGVKAASLEKINLKYIITPTAGTIAGEVCEVVSTLSVVA